MHTQSSTYQYELNISPEQISTTVKSYSKIETRKSLIYPYPTVTLLDFTGVGLLLSWLSKCRCYLGAILDVVQQGFTQILITSLTTHLKTFTKTKPLCLAWLRVYLLEFQEPFLGKRCVLAFFFSPTSTMIILTLFKAVCLF